MSCAAWVAANRPPYPVGPCYRGLILTALRARELLNTERAEWNLRGNSWERTIPSERMKGKLAHLVPVTADLRSLVYDACPKQQGQFLFSHNSGESPMRLSEKMKEKLDAEMLNVLRELAVEREQLWRDAEHSAEFANRRRRHDVRLGLARFHLSLIHI